MGLFDEYLSEEEKQKDDRAFAYSRQVELKQAILDMVNENPKITNEKIAFELMVGIGFVETMICLLQREGKIQIPKKEYIRHEFKPLTNTDEDINNLKISGVDKALLKDMRMAQMEVESREEKKKQRTIRNKSKVQQRREKVFECIEANPDYTDQEICKILDETIAVVQSCRKALERLELEELGGNENEW